MSQHLNFWKISLLLLLGFFVFFYIVASTFADIYALMSAPKAGFESQYDEGKTIITEVIPNSPADRAGIRPGDIVSAVNNKQVGNVGGLADALSEVAIGDTVELTVERNGSQEKLSLVMGRQLTVYRSSIFVQLLPGLIFCYGLSLIGIFVLVKRIEDQMAHIFYVMVLMWALVIWDQFIGFGTLKSILPFWFKELTLLPAGPLAVSLLFHFYLIFPLEKAFYKKNRRILLLAIYAPVVMVLPHFYASAVKLEWGEHLLDLTWGPWLILYLLLALFTLAHSMITASNSAIKKQAQITFWGTCLGLALPLLLYFFSFVLFRERLLDKELFLPMLVFWPISLAYAIIKHRFMDIDLIIKRGLAYALVSGFVIAAYFLFVVGVGRLVLYMTGSTNQLVTILATLIIAALFNPVKNKIQSFVDKKFFPARFSYHEAVREFRHKLVNVVDLEKLQDLLISFFYKTMRIQTIILLWDIDGRGQFKIQRAEGIKPQEELTFSLKDKVIEHLQNQRQLVDLTPLKEQLYFIPESEKKQWDKLQTELILPLLTKNRMIGLFCFGPKIEDDPFYKEDLDLLESLGDQINISLQNALLTEELREQDRLRKELEVARRIQMSSLPQCDPDIPGLEISGISIPALEVGGDYYDYLDFLDGRFGVVVGDVSGKGTSAALYMTQLKGILKTASKYHKTLKDLITEANSIAFDSIEGQSFITLTCGAFNLKASKFSLVRAGHLPLIYYSKSSNRCQLLEPKGIGIGLDIGEIFKKELQELEIKFKSGDIFIFYSDGITEARNKKGDEFQTEPLLEVLQQNGFSSAHNLREKIISKVKVFSGNSAQIDDMTLVVVKVK